MAANQPVPSDGIYNPNAFLLTGVFGPLFLAGVPLTSWATQPNGLIQSTIHAFLNTIAYVSTAGSTTSLPPSATLPALTAVYIAVTYAFTGGASVAAVTAGNPKGRDNKAPRANETNLKGLPLRMKSAHMNLVEMFPGFAVTAALAAALAPQDQQIINLLGLHVLAKVGVYYPMYLLNLDTPRSLSHVVATSSVINVAWRLAMAAR